MLRKISNTLDQMLEDRGYEPLDDTPYTSGRLFMSRNGDGTAYVFVSNKSDGKVLGTDDIDQMLRSLRDTEASRGIIVGRGVSPQAGELIRTNNRSSSESYLEFFFLEHLQYNPTRTILYNPHNLVTGTSLDEIRRVYAVNGDNSLHNLPKLLSSDPIVQYFGWRVGDVIRVVRTPKRIREFTPRTTNEIVYRLVV